MANAASTYLLRNTSAHLDGMELGEITPSFQFPNHPVPSSIYCGEGIGKFWDGIKAYWKTGATKEREGIRWLMTRKTTHWQYTNGVRDVSLVSPDAETVDQVLLDRPGNQEIQLDLFYDYRTNIPLYPQWQAYFKKHQPPMLIVWGQNDEIFIAPGAKPYQREIPNAEIHMIDTGHFALVSFPKRRPFSP
jgi:pimeloyl-ACP methyl ester carboxylesterase